MTPLDKVTPTPAQKRAWLSLKRAHTKCIDLGIRFEMIDEWLFPLNDEFISYIEEGNVHSGNDHIAIELEQFTDLALNLDATPWVDVGVIVEVYE